MSMFAIYDDSGQILRTGTCSPSLLPIQAQEGEFLLELQELDWNIGNVYYVLDGTLVEKEELPVSDTFEVQADGSSLVRFPLPDRTAIIYNGDYNVGGPFFEFVTSSPGEYVFDFYPHGKYKYKKVTIRAV